MKQVTNSVFYVMVFFALYVSCKKAETLDVTTNQDAVNSSKTYSPSASDIVQKIANAKKFFLENVEKNADEGNYTKKNTGMKTRHQIKKYALWENAYIGQTKSKGEVVIVPIRYEKPLMMITSFGNGKKVSMEGQSHLWIYKNTSSNYVAAIITVLPDKKYQEGNMETFSGYILEEDWAGNNIKRHFVENGKSYSRKKKASVLNGSNTSTARQVCDAINWYLCDVDNSGNLSNCVFQFTEILDCYDDGQGEIEDDFDNGDLGGGITEDIVSSNMSTTKSWQVTSDAYATVLAQEVIKGVRSFANTSTKYNHFTSIAPGSPIFTNNLFYKTSVIKPNGQIEYTINEATWGFTEGAHGNSLDSTTVGASVSCNYSQQDVQQNPNSPGTYTTIPVGSPHTELRPNSKYWGFYDVF